MWPTTCLTRPEEPLLELNAAPLEPAAVTLVRGGKPSAGGGVANDNPAPGKATASAWPGSAREARSFGASRSRSATPSSPCSGTPTPTLTCTSSSRAARRFTGRNPKGDRAASSTSIIPRDSAPKTSTGLSSRTAPGSTKVKGPGPPGVYQWFVVYWGGFGGVRQADALEGADQACRQGHSDQRQVPAR